MNSGSQKLLASRGLRADLAALSRLSHLCDPALCAESGSCCERYTVWLGRAERNRILERADLLQPYLEEGREAEAFRLPIRQTGPGLWTVERDAGGLCRFATTAEGGRVLCSLHLAALDEETTPAGLKPDSCTLWPLSLTSSDPPVLSVQEGAYAFPCNRRREPDGRLDAGVAAIVDAALGRDVLREIRAALAEGPVFHL